MDAILQARMKSSRLPGKVLMPILGRPVILYNIERIAAARNIDRVIVAMSDAPEDDALEAACREAGVPSFRGSENDVLDRITRAAAEFAMNDVFAKFTGDNPLIDPAVIDEVIDASRAGVYDYFSNNHPPTWQDGQEVEVIRFAALERAAREATKDFQREHVTPYIWDQPETFRVGNIARADQSWYHAHRWTLDYPEDFDFIRAVFEALYPSKPLFSTADIMDLTERNRAIHALNAKHAGYSWYDKHLDELKTVHS